LTLFLLIPALFACDNGVKQRYADLAKADTLRQDSIMTIKNQLLNDMLVSTQFVNDISAEIAKARSLPKSVKDAKLSTPAEAANFQADRDQVLGKIRHLVARLDSVDSRLAGLRKQAVQFAQRDTMLTQQIAQYEKTISDFRETVERQKTEFQGIIDQQNVQIAALKNQVDTVTQVAAKLTTDKAAYVDTVTGLVKEKNSAYYVAGTKDELIQKGVLVEEGRKPYLLFGSRRVAPARSLDSTIFVQIDRLKDRDITLPDGEYQILSRQDPQFTQPVQVKDGKIVGGLKITAPEKFWAPSRFLILVRS
jgi:predicted  nucleic acid-binding Zn-ribbon protein